MLRTTKSKTINGGAWVTQGESEIQVVSMHASVDNMGNQNYNNSIINQSLYQLNKEEIDKDIEEFKKMAADLTWEEA